MKKLVLSAACLCMALLVAPVNGQFVINEAGPINSAGAIGSPANTTFTGTYGGANAIFNTFNFVGDLTEVNTATFASEADFNITNGLGDVDFDPTTTGGFTGTINVTSTLNGLYWVNTGDTFSIESFESFDDDNGSSIDSIWNNVSFTWSGSATFTSLGSFFEGELTFDSEGSAYDTEIGLYRSDGTLVANDDDGGTGSLSSLTETLVAGDYIVVLGGFNSTFFDGAANAGAGNGAFNFNINGNSVDSGTSTASQFEAYSFTVNAIPEPSSMLVLVGLGAVAGFVRRRRK